MKRLIIGIDFSLNSCAVTYRSNDKLLFSSIVNRWIFSTAKEFDKNKIFSNNPLLGKLENIISLKFSDRKPISVPNKTKILKKFKTGKGKEFEWNDLSNWQQAHISQYKSLVDLIFNEIISTVATNFKEYKKEEIYISLENYDYGGRDDTSSLMQICEYTSNLKSKLTDVFKVENFYVASPKEIKLIAGKGDYQKYDMFLSFKNNFNTDVTLKDNKFWQFIKSIKENEIITEKFKNKKIKIKGIKDTQDVKISEKYLEKPLDDLIDSYFVMLWLEINLIRNELKSNSVF